MVFQAPELLGPMLPDPMLPDPIGAKLGLGNGRFDGSLEVVDIGGLETDAPYTPLIGTTSTVCITVMTCSLTPS